MIDMNLNWGFYYDDDSSSDSDSSNSSHYVSTSGVSDSSDSWRMDENNEKCKRELQKLLDSSKLSDKENLNAKIIDIVKRDSTVLFMYLIANNYKLEVLNKRGQTALHLASYYGHDILNLIVDFPNYVTENRTDCNGLSYLHIASSIAHEKLARRCLKAGVDVNAQFHTDPKGLRSKFTALHYSASVMLKESRKVMKLLLNNGADVNAVDYLGRTPLHIACQVYEEPFLFSDTLYSCSSTKFVKFLIENGSNPDARDSNGNTALLSIVPDNYNQFCFDVNVDSHSLPYLEIREKLEYFLKKDFDFLATNHDGNTILHRIIENLKQSRFPNDGSVDFSYDADYAKMIKRILAANTGIDVNAKNCFGDTPLQLAVCLMSLDIVKVLLQHNANLNSLTFSHDDQYCFYCPNNFPNLDVVQNVISIIKLLLKEGWKLTFQDNLLLMKFLAHDIDHCECGNTSIIDNEIQSNLLNLVNSGSVQHFEQVFDKVMNEFSSQNKLFTRDHLLKEISKALHYRKIFNLYVDNNIVNAAKKHLPRVCTFKESESSSKKNEIVRMKYTKLKGNVTLYDVMTRHPHKIYGYVKNQNFDKITRYLVYMEDAVKGHAANALVRHHIEKLAIQYLRILFFPSIPSLCCKQILGFLSNTEIVNMCSAAVLEEV